MNIKQIIELIAYDEFPSYYLTDIYAYNNVIILEGEKSVNLDRIQSFLDTFEECNLKQVVAIYCWKGNCTIIWKDFIPKKYQTEEIEVQDGDLWRLENISLSKEYIKKIFNR